MERKNESGREQEWERENVSVNFMDLRFFSCFDLWLMFVGKVFRPDLYFMLLKFGLSRGKLRMLFLFRLKNFLGNSVFRDVPVFLFFDHKDVLDFLEFYLKLFFFFYYQFFSKILSPFPLGGLWQWPTWPSGRAGLTYRFDSFTIPKSMDGKFWLFGRKKKWQISSSKFFLFFKFTLFFFFW